MSQPLSANAGETMNTLKIILLALVTTSALFSQAALADRKVKITPELGSIEVLHLGKKVIIERNQNVNNTVDADYAKTSRHCPPFCIRPIKLTADVETIGELELLQYLKKIGHDKSVMVIDSRNPSSIAKGTIPGSVNIPWSSYDINKGATDLDVESVLADEFGASLDEDDKWDFSQAKTLVIFCNGMWCGNAPNNIYFLLSLGYPADKLKWYRGGMQTWHALGFSTVSTH